VARDATAAGARPVVWVVGASSGIGREIARSFAAIGAVVCVSARRGALLGRLRREIETAGGRAFVVPFDVTDANATRSAWKTVRAKAGPVDVLVNNAGVTVFKDFLRTSAREFDSIVATNLLGPSCCIRAVLPDMVRRRRGWIFNILSNAAVKTFEGSAAYTASKAGMLGFGRVLREELRTHRVRVVSILPGATDTPMWSPAARRKNRTKMMSARGVAEAVVSAYLMPSDVVVDEMIIRPIGGDLA
jgi:NADP-dependent 3-hydroxy acid dehydrogenase YdfG